MSGALLKNSRAGPADSRARIIRLVSTTRRTLAFLTPLPANFVYFGLNLVVGDRPNRPAVITIREGRLKPLGEQTIQKCLAIVWRKLPDEIENLHD